MVYGEIEGYSHTSPSAALNGTRFLEERVRRQYGLKHDDDA